MTHIFHDHVTSTSIFFSSSTLLSMALDRPERIKQEPTFDTLQRQKLFRHPKQTGSNAPILNEFVKPHIESFNALFDDHAENGDGRGLISLALKDIGERVVFDGHGQTGLGSDEGAWGNRMSSESSGQRMKLLNTHSWS